MEGSLCIEIRDSSLVRWFLSSFQNNSFDYFQKRAWPWRMVRGVTTLAGAGSYLGSYNGRAIFPAVAMLTALLFLFDTLIDAIMILILGVC